MNIQQRYQLWKSEPFNQTLTKERVIDKIQEVTRMLCAFYGLNGLTEGEASLVMEYVFRYLQRFQLFKLCDIDRAFELYRKSPELHKITPAYFENILNTYRKSEERAEILRMHNAETENRLPEDTTKTPDQLLAECRAHYQIHDEIRLNSGKVYAENFKKIIEALGIDRLKQIDFEVRETEKERIAQMMKNATFMAERHELEALLKNEGHFKVLVRKRHMAEYFEWEKIFIDS